MDHCAFNINHTGCCFFFCCPNLGFVTSPAVDAIVPWCFIWWRLPWWWTTPKLICTTVIRWGSSTTTSVDIRIATGTKVVFNTVAGAFATSAWHNVGTIHSTTIPMDGDSQLWRPLCAADATMPVFASPRAREHGRKRMSHGTMWVVQLCFINTNEKRHATCFTILKHTVQSQGYVFLVPCPPLLAFHKWSRWQKSVHLLVLLAPMLTVLAM